MSKVDDLFERYNDEHSEFDRIKNPRSTRADLHAFLLLDSLFPSTYDIVEYAEHDEIYLDVSDKQIKKLTNDQVLELVRCGVFYSEGSLMMYT